MTPHNTQELSRRLAAADPAPATLLEGDDLEQALDQIGAAITSSARPSTTPSRRTATWRSRRVFLIAAAATALIAGGAAAATTFLSARTGQYAHGWQAKAGGPGEYLRIGAPDFCRVALGASSGMPYPSGDGAWRRWVLAAELGVPLKGGCASHQQPGAEVSTGALRGFFAMSAFCAWTYAWKDARSAGDSAAANQAAHEIAAASRWPAVTAEDPHPSAGPLHETREGLTGSHSLFGWFLPFRRAVVRGDSATVERLIASNYGTAGCSYFRPRS